MKSARLVGIVVALLLATGWYSACSNQEHPQESPREHPTTPSKEHPAVPSKEQPAGEHPAKEHPTEQTKEQMQAEFTKTVMDHINRSSEKTEGFFVVKDDKLNKDWKLKLVRIHSDKIVQLSDGRRFACSDFAEGTDMVDLDFYAKKATDGWQVNEVMIHKVNGKPRFTYNDKNERVPVAE